MGNSNAFIYVSLFCGFLFASYNLWKLKSLPLLAELFSLMLSVAAAYSGIVLGYSVLEAGKNLGDFQDQKLIIVLGALAVFWVSLITSVNLVRGVNARAEFQSRLPHAASQEGS